MCESRGMASGYVPPKGEPSPNEIRCCSRRMSTPRSSRRCWVIRASLAGEQEAKEGRRGLSEKKGGPKSTEGREVARWNATRHGMRSPAPVVPGIESTEDWERHLAGTLESLVPEGHLETVLAERVALLSWRLHRVTRYETESIALYQEKAEDDLAQERRYEGHVLGPAHPENVRDELEFARANHRLLKKLPGLPDDKHLSGADAAGVLWGVSAYIEDEDLEKVQPPSGVPEWA